MMFFSRTSLCILLLMLTVPVAVAFAQDVPVLEEQEAAETENDTASDDVQNADEAVADQEENQGGGESADKPLSDGFSAEEKRSMSLMQAFPQMVSLFFSRWEHDLIIDARLGLNVRPPESPVEDLSSPASIQATDSSIRELSLGGIVYHSANSWTFWLNGMRITPNGLPEQVMNLKVFKDYIEIEWLDTSTNQIYPIRLRPHQRFNLDSRIFLPG